MKKIIIFGFLLTSIFLSLFCFMQYSNAMEITYPEIKTITGDTIQITDETTPTGVFVYIFYILVSLGAVIALVVLVLAGLNLVMAGGEISKVSGAKRQIMGAVIGLVVLFSSYLILSIINPELLKIKANPIDCDKVPICIEFTRIASIMINPDGTEDKKFKTATEMSIPSANTNLVLQDGESIFIKKYTGLKEIWGFPESDFKGTPIKIYQSTNSDINEVVIDKELSPFGGSQIKSYKIVNKNEGIYLYDKINLEISDGTIAPFYTNSSVSDFSKTNPDFFQRTKSAEIISPRLDPAGFGPSPGAIFFSEPQFRGSCAGLWGYTDRVANDLNTRQNLDWVGNFGYNLSSVIIYHTGDGKYIKKGSVTFYNSLNCKKDINNLEEKECEIDWLGGPTGNIVEDKCELGYKIKSFVINGPIGVVLMEGGRCQYFNKKDFTNGNCVSSILETNVSNPDFFMLLPDDN